MDLWSIIRADLNIADMIRPAEGFGPHTTIPMDMGCLVAGKDPVAVDQKEGGEDRFKLDNALGIRSIEETAAELAFDSPFAQELVGPRPGLVVYVHEILIIEMNLGELSFVGNCRLRRLFPVSIQITHSLLADSNRCSVYRPAFGVRPQGYVNIQSTLALVKYGFAPGALSVTDGDNLWHTY